MDIESILTLIGITGTPQRVLIELFTTGPQTVAFLAKKLSLPRPSVYDALHILEEKTLVVNQDENGKRVFSANRPDAITQLLDSSAERITKAKSEFSEIMPKLMQSPRITEPKIRMFSGKEGCQQTMRDLLWYKNIETYTLWPMYKMLDIISPEFLEWHNKRRTANNMSIKAIREVGDKVDIDTQKYPYLGSRPEDLRETRFLPEDIDLSMSYWIYDNNVAFISAGEELYGFIVQSKEFADMMKFNFNLLWKIAKKQ
jgi:sugar-specific transcriptional regulator TrmB